MDIKKICTYHKSYKIVSKIQFFLMYEVFEIGHNW